MLLGQVLQEQADPGLVVREALRVLKPGGRVAITSNYGELRGPPFNEPLYLKGLIELLARSVEIDDISLLGQSVAMAGRAITGAGSAPSAQTWLRALEAAERHLAGTLDASVESQETLERTQAELQAHRRRAARREAAQERERADLRRAVAAAARRLAADESNRGDAARQLSEISAEIRRLEQELAVERELTGSPGARREDQPGRDRPDHDKSRGAAPAPARALNGGRARPPRVLHLIGRPIPQPASAIAIDHHGLMLALRDAGVDAGALTVLNGPPTPEDGGSGVCEFIDGIAYYPLRSTEAGDPESGLDSLIPGAERLLEIVRPEILHAASAEAAPLATVLGRRYSIPVITELECVTFLPDSMLSEAIAGADRVVAVNDRQYGRAVAAGVRQSSLRVVPAFVDRDWFAATRGEGADSGATRIVGTVAYRGDSPAIATVRDFSDDSESIRRLVVRIGDRAVDLPPDDEPPGIGAIERIDVTADEVASSVSKMDVVVAATPHEALDALAVGQVVVGVASAVDVVPQAGELPELLTDRELAHCRATEAREHSQIRDPAVAVNSYLELYSEIRS